MVNLGPIKTAILCGGMGSRLREHTEFMPKPLVSIGGMPILWHIMKIYSQHGFRDFVLCLGYKGEMIKSFFMDYPWMVSDFTLHLRERGKVEHHSDVLEDWKVTFADTGADTNTAGRLWNARKYLEGGRFMMTYADGVADIDIKELVDYHTKKGKTATISCTNTDSKFGHVLANEDLVVRSFEQKPRLADYINIGFAIFEQDIFGYIKKDCAIEDIFQELIKDGELVMYPHHGFFHCMDTYKDFQDLNRLWDSGAPWKVWT